MKNFQLQGLSHYGILACLCEIYPKGTVVYDRSGYLNLTKQLAFEPLEVKDKFIFETVRDAQRALGIYCKKNKIKFKYSKRSDCVKK